MKIHVSQQQINECRICGLNPIEEAIVKYVSDNVSTSISLSGQCVLIDCEKGVFPLSRAVQKFMRDYDLGIEVRPITFILK